MSDSLEIADGSLSDHILSSQNDGWALIWSSDGRASIKRGVRHCEEDPDPDQAGWIPYATDLLSEDDDAGFDVRVRVHLDMFKRTCSFMFNGVDLGVAWSDFPTSLLSHFSLIQCTAFRRNKHLLLIWALLR
ncbi:hypothetical protein R1flu_013854 [Riccia fluitans]|uniref:Uncharacterized protein n=1 Tax=Riccia fluitans TaxID=41844 RepID=A0ABD1YET3_9MARC